MEAKIADFRTVMEVWLDRAYEYLPDFRVLPGWTVLDLGANKGAFSIKAALVDPSVTVHAYEPVPANVRYMLTNISDNMASNVTLFQKALSSDSGPKELFLACDQRPDGHSLFRDRAGSANGESIQVDAVSLDIAVSLLGPRIDLVKMDIEGAELSTIQTSSSNTLFSIKRIVVECHSIGSLEAAEVAERLRGHLAAAGFLVATSPTANLIYAWKDQ